MLIDVDKLEVFMDYQAS